jgi:glucoamylase
MPLVWAHAEFLKLLAARRLSRPLELLGSVERRYRARRPTAAAWHWRLAEPFDVLPYGRALLIESLNPFLLHFGFDGWRHIADVRSEPQGLSMHGVRFDAPILLDHSVIDFTFYFVEQGQWGGTDHHITIRHG